MRVVALSMLLISPLLGWQEAKPLPKEMQSALETREQRGQEIFEYERLAWVASDMLVASHPAPGQADMWVEVPNGNRRYILFGRFKTPKDPPEQPDGFFALFIYWAPIGKPDEVHAVPPPAAQKPASTDEETKRLIEATKDVFPLAQAADLIRHQPSPWHMTWNYDVFREKDGTITGYLLPGNMDASVIPIGGDFRITLDSTGTKILKTVTLHKSYLPMSTQGGPNGEKTVGGYHTHTLEEDLPPETDLGVLRLYPGGVPHFLVTRFGVFKFTDQYKLIYLGTLKEFTNNK